MLFIDRCNQADTREKERRNAFSILLCNATRVFFNDVICSKNFLILGLADALKAWFQISKRTYALLCEWEGLTISIVLASNINNTSVAFLRSTSRSSTTLRHIFHFSLEMTRFIESCGSFHWMLFAMMMFVDFLFASLPTTFKALYWIYVLQLLWIYSHRLGPCRTLFIFPSHLLIMLTFGMWKAVWVVEILKIYRKATSAPLVARNIVVFGRSSKRNAWSSILRTRYYVSSSSLKTTTKQITLINSLQKNLRKSRSILVTDLNLTHMKTLIVLSRAQLRSIL